jgi:MoaA/NifB/PqqE/SkfB family radical SAM enzyme
MFFDALKKRFRPKGRALQRACPAPFKHFEVDTRGEVHVCCPGWLKQRKNIGNLKDSGLMEIWNSPSARAFRESVYDGTYRFCNEEICPYLKNNNLPLVQSLDEEIRSIVSLRRTKLDSGPREMYLNYDRTCNLFCESCRKEKIVLSGKALEQATLIHQTLLDSQFAGVKRLVVTGMGDPFASKLYMQALKSVTVASHPDLRIRLFTNGLLLTPQSWQYLGETTPLIDEIFISVDAARGRTYRQLRRGGDFDLLRRNLNFVARLKAEGKIRRFRISMVVQQANYREMKEFLQMGQQLDADIVYFSQIRNWNTYSADEFKAIAVHDPNNAYHEDFIALLRDPIFLDPRCQLNTLKQFALQPSQTHAGN